jgi:hypothetical protein
MHEVGEQHCMTSKAAPAMLLSPLPLLLKAQLTQGKSTGT